MMWLHRDLAWWGVVLGSLALVLMVPANLLANFLTPLLKNWWAERSTISTRERIKKLEKELSELEKRPAISEAEHYILIGIEAIAPMIGLILPLCGLAMLVFVTKESDSFVRTWGATLGFLVAIVGVVPILISFSITKFRTTRSPIIRKRLRKSIEELQLKLKRAGLPE